MTETESDSPVEKKEMKLAVAPNPRVKFSIVHEDADLLVIEKPAGLVVQPGKGHTTDSLLNGLFNTHGKFLHNLGVRRDFGLLHRLDKDTSGLVLVALRPNSYDQLRRDFEERRIEKAYLTIVAGVPKPPQGVVQARLKEVTAGIKKVIISRQGQEAISAYQVLASSPTGSASLIRVLIKTGRLHQIRAHMMFLNTPVLGDDIYAPAATTKSLLRPHRLALHAAHIGFKHPTNSKWLKFDSPLPVDLARFAERLGISEDAVNRKS